MLTYVFRLLDGPDILLKHEEFVRFALSMARSPAPLFINTGGEKGNCPSKVDGAENGLLQKYAKWGINGVCLQAGLITHEGDESQCYPKCYEGKKWGAVGDGTHSSTNIDSPNKSLPTSVPLNKNNSFILLKYYCSIILYDLIPHYFNTVIN